LTHMWCGLHNPPHLFAQLSRLCDDGQSGIRATPGERGDDDEFN